MTDRGLSPDALAWIQRCQSTALAWAHRDHVAMIIALVACFTTVPLLRTNMDRVGVSSALLRLAWKARTALVGTAPDLSNSRPRHMPRRMRAIAVLMALVDLRNDPDVTLTELAFRMEMSVCYLSRLIQREIGAEFWALRHALRLVDVIVLIRTTTLPIGDIAEACGYKRGSDMDRQFARWFHITPREFRRMEWHVTRRREESIAMVHRYLCLHPEARPAEISDTLGVDFGLVLQHCQPAALANATPSA